MTDERVSTSVDGYDVEYSRGPVLELLALAMGSWPHRALGGTGWSGRVHGWSLIPTADTDPLDPSVWMLTATEPETGMVGSVEFDRAGNVTGILVSDTETLSCGGPLRALMSGWVNALRGAGTDPISSRGDILYRRTGEPEWGRTYLRVGEECGGPEDLA